MVRVKQTFPVEVEDVNVVSVDDDPIVNNQKKFSFPCDQPTSSIVSKKQANAASYVGPKRLDKNKCSFNCQKPVYSSCTIHNERQAEFVFDSLGVPFSRSWTKRYYFCQFHSRKFHDANEEWNSIFAVKKRRLEPELPEECSLVVSKKAPQVAVKRKDPSSTPTSQPCCDVCGWNEGIFETIENLSYARHIDRILGSRISENWKGSAKICLCHILECGKEKNHIPWYLQRPRRVHCTLCFETFISPPNDTAPPGSHSVYCPLCVKKMRQRKCSICGKLIDLFQCVQVNNIAMKAKLNAFFRTNMELDEHTKHMCSHHWNQWFDQHINAELTVASNSTERLDFGILPNKRETKEEIEEEFGDSVETRHQSIDMKETNNNQLVKDEVINVEQLIGQGQKIPPRNDHKSDVPPIVSDDLRQCTVSGDVLIDSDYRSNSEILLKEEMTGELEDELDEKPRTFDS